MLNWKTLAPNLKHFFPVDTGRKLNVQFTFSLRPVSTGLLIKRHK